MAHNKLIIENWDKWQSYRKDRGQPPWIKIHRRLLRNPEWVSLTDAERGQLVVMWLLAADHDGVIDMPVDMIQKLGFMSSKINIHKFIDLGFISSNGCQCDANTTPTRRQDVTPKAEAETDKSIKTYAQSNKRFARFWEAYPKKKSKGSAEKAWKAINPDEQLLASMIATIERAKKSDDWLKDAGQFIPYPSTWLRAKGWEDEIFIKTQTIKEQGLCAKCKTRKAVKYDHCQECLDEEEK